MIKQLTFIVLLAPALTFVIGCAKKPLGDEPLASVKIVNAVTGGGNVYFGNRSLPINNGQSGNFTLFAGKQDIYIWPFEDSSRPYFKSEKAITFEENGLYTLFLGGTSEAPEGILVKENLPVRIDSTAGIRVINLSPNSGPINITLASIPTVNVFSDVAFKEITEFKSFQAASTNMNYMFEVRSVSDPNMILASFNLNGYNRTSSNFIPRFRNMTFVFNGVVDGTPAPRLLRANHYYDK